MRLTTVLLLACLLQVSAVTFAQRVTINQRNVSLESVFKEIRKQSGYSFIYDVKLLKDTSPLNIAVVDASVEEALTKVLDGLKLTYEIDGKIVSIKKKPEPSFFDNLSSRFAGIDVRGKVLGENNQVLAGAVVRVKGIGKAVRTDEKGEFLIGNVDENAVLVISYLGYESKEIKATKDLGVITLVMSTGQLAEVGVVSTGYQQIPKERATGSFVQIDNEDLNRRVSTSILDRLDGITSGLLFNGTASKNIRVSPAATRNLGINIRGESTILGTKDPLIVLDNFPYEGDIRNINPNDIESVTVLKDAAAASIWGARAGNGVIVISTKKGTQNSKMSIELNANVMVANRPDLFVDKNYLTSGEFIEVEKFLFDKGYFNSDISNTTAMTAISPVVDILAQQRAGTISSIEAENRLDRLRKNDVRNDFEKYVYQKAISQQYSLGIRGGGENSTYALSVGYDKNLDAVIRNGYNRITINSFNTYRPIKNLEISAGLNYSLNNTLLNNAANLYGSVYSMTPRYNRIFPYSALIEDNGTASVLVKTIKSSYVDQTRSKGFLDWNYRPLDEIANADNTTKIADLLLRAGAKYTILSGFNAEVNFQSDQQIIRGQNNQNQLTYFTRDLINKFSQYDANTNTLTYIFPLGSIKNITNNEWRSNSLRGQLNYNETFGKHQVVALAGAEVRETKASGFGRTSYGFDDQFGTSVMNLNYTTSYPVNPSGTARITAPDGNVNTYLNRFISYYANVAYTFQEKYTLNLSGRKDGSNIFGASANNRITPLWSAGASWAISKEHFYDVEWIPDLKIRATYGYNGNIGNAIALLTGRYTTYNITGQQYLNVISAPNPELRWERVKNINLGVDFGSSHNILRGSIEFYRKDGIDLLQPTPLAPQTGFSTYTSNAASTRTAGVDLTLQSENINGQFKWSTVFLLSAIKDKILHYDVKPTSSSIQTTGGAVLMIDKPMYSIFSYKWAGLDPENGDPKGYLNGLISKDYAGIINNFNPDSLVYNGSARPTIFGSLRNDFSYKGFGLSLNMVYKLGYYLRKPSISLNYSDLISSQRNTDYGLRWQKSGDELNSNVPSLTYPSNSSRNAFYQYSEILVQSGDHIRLQDIRLSYLIPQNLIKGISRLQVYTYLNNLGIIWRKNDSGIDTDSYGLGGTTAYPNPFSISFGINANF